MDFSLTEMQEEFRTYVRKVLTKESATQIVRDVAKGDETLLTDAHNKLTDLGIMGISIAEEYGGLELGSTDFIPVMEELGRAVMPDVYAETLAFVAPLIAQYGTAQQKQDYLGAITEGSRLLSLAWIEPNGSYNEDSISTSVRETADGLVLTGEKTVVRLTEQVTHLLVVAKDDQQNIRLLIVPRKNGKYVKQKSFDETQSFYRVTFEDELLGKDQEIVLPSASLALQQASVQLLASINSMMVGAMDRLVEMCTEYAKMREQFGQPIGRFQAIKHRLADCKVMLESARALSHYAAWTVENNSEDRLETVLSAKAMIVDSFIKISGESVQIHGGIGFTEELDCHLYVKRARVYENYLGSQYAIREKAAAAMGW